MSSPRLSVPKVLLARLGTVPYDVVASFEGVAANTIYNMLEDLSAVGGHWLIRETGGANAVTLTQDTITVYTCPLNGSLESEVTLFQQLTTNRGAAGVYNLYIEGWSLDLIRALAKEMKVSW